MKKQGNATAKMLQEEVEKNRMAFYDSKSIPELMDFRNKNKLEPWLKKELEAAILAKAQNEKRIREGKLPRFDIKTRGLKPIKKRFKKGHRHCPNCDDDVNTAQLKKFDGVCRNCWNAGVRLNQIKDENVAME